MSSGVCRWLQTRAVKARRLVISLKQKSKEEKRNPHLCNNRHSDSLKSSVSWQICRTSLVGLSDSCCSHLFIKGGVFHLLSGLWGQDGIPALKGSLWYWGKPLMRPLVQWCNLPISKSWKSSKILNNSEKRLFHQTEFPVFLWNFLLQYVR